MAPPPDRAACRWGTLGHFSEDGQVKRIVPNLIQAAAFALCCAAALPGSVRADTLRHDGVRCAGVCAVADAQPRRPRLATRHHAIRHDVAAQAGLLLPEPAIRVPSRYVSLLILGVAY